MSEAEPGAGELTDFIDLRAVPYTVAFSRVLVRRAGSPASGVADDERTSDEHTPGKAAPDEGSDARAGVVVELAEYERSPADRRLAEIAVTGPDGDTSVWLPDAVTVSLGGARLRAAAERAVRLDLGPGQWTVVLRTTAPTQSGWADAGRAGRPGSGRHGSIDPHTGELRVGIQSRGPSRPAVTEVAPGTWRLRYADGTGCALWLGAPVPTTCDDEATAHAALLAEHRAWAARCPRVRPRDRQLVARAWWTLGVNRVHLATHPDRAVIVPSKLGYVGAWQWDSYFIAAGIRHGDPELARDQIRLFLDHQQPDGVLPDVVCDLGVIASTADLPASDSLADGSAARAGAPVAVTKPPLTAWAVRAVHAVAPDRAFLAETYPPIARCQHWWSTGSDPDGDGLAEYLHAYSSGLDNSPLFDGGAPARTPDLAAYLVRQDQLLAATADELGCPQQAAAHRRAAATRLARSLAADWDAATGRFVAWSRGVRTTTDTPFGLLPLLAEHLDPVVANRLVAALADPHRFAGDHGVPTVAFDDPAFDADRMWRGPAWLNVHRLLVEGLLIAGHDAAARDLAERSLALVRASGGFPEYVNSRTGATPARATTGFAWTAALTVDLAVMLAGTLRPVQ